LASRQDTRPKRRLRQPVVVGLAWAAPNATYKNESNPSDLLLGEAARPVLEA
jgi:hypothetical protein